MAQTKHSIRKTHSPKTHPAVVVAAGAAIAFFFTQGLPLWNEDYSRWIVQAQGSFLTLIARILLPMTWEPETWGYGDRPLQVLAYKVLHGIFGNWGTGYFFVKSLGFGGLCWMLWRWMERLGVSRTIAWLSLGIFALSANVVGSVLWLADFGVFSQLLVAWILFEAGAELRNANPRSAKFKKVFVVFFCAVYFGAKIKGDVRLAPLILLAYLAIYDTKKLRTLWPWLAGAFAATLPWSVAMFKHLPPFLGGAGYQGWTYRVFSFSRVVSFIAGDALTLKNAPLSLVGAIGIFALIAAFSGVVRRLSQDRLEAPDKEIGLLWIWLAFSVFVLGVMTPQNSTFEMRYTLVSLVPATLLLAKGLEAARREFAFVRHFSTGLIVLLAVQCLLQARHAVQHRRDMGHTLVGINGLYSTIENRHRDSQFLLGDGFLNYGYASSTSSAIQNRKSISEMGDASHLQPQNTYVASWSATLDTHYAVETVSSGCGESAFDLIFACGPNEAAFLLKYVGEVPEVAQADALERRGDLRGARQLLETYWLREPGNHGVAFILGLDDYKLGDFAAMERVYDSFAPYFPAHASVVYNWALAKMGVQKLADASKYFERAYSLAPGDYGIGFNLADTYYKLGKRSRALATVNELLRAHPQDEALARAKQQYTADNGKRP